MHFHINSVTGIWIGNYNHLVSSSCNIPQFPHFGGYTKILTEIGRSPFHHTFTESSRLTQQSISRVDCHFFPSCHFTFSTTQGGGGGGGRGGPGGGSKPPTTHLLCLAFPARALHPPFSFVSSVSIATYQASLRDLPLILLLLLLNLSFRSSFSYLPSPGPPHSYPPVLPHYAVMLPIYLNAKNFRITKEIVVQYPTSNMTLLYRRSIILIKLRCEFKSKSRILMEVVP